MHRILPLLLLVASSATATDIFDIRVQKVVDGVYVASRPEPLRPYVEGNVTIIVNEHDVVVVDAGGSPRAARNVIAEIKKLTPNPVRWLIYTHIHRDHRFGTQEFVKAFPGIEIVAHPEVRRVVEGDPGTFVAGRIERLENNRAEALKDIERFRAAGNETMAVHLERYREDVPEIVEQYRGIVNLPPTASFHDRLTLHRGARIIDIRFLGRGDTDHDVIVHLPKDRVVVAGDMVAHPFPYGFSPHADEWIATMTKLAELDFEYLVPGHGDVQRGKTYLNRVIELVKAVQTPGADLSAFEKEMAGDDPVRRYYFHELFVKPAVAEVQKKKAAPAR
jgi:glyoxylase-like metal-dependent hydrolase (beta-lactamase superfamily II)